MTGGGVVGLADPTHTRSLINDSRVAGWILGIEWDFDSAETNYYNADHAFLTKYWQFFWSTVHYNGANSSFATLYPKGTPSDGNNDSNCSDTSGRLSYENTNLQGMMTFFKSQSSSPPDLFMAEWYGVGNYPLACIGNDVASLITGTASLGRGIGLSRGVLLAEGGTNETSNSTAAKQFMENAINAAATNGGAGFAGPWDSDGLIDLMYTPTCPANVKTATPTSLYTANGFDPTGQGVLNSGAINYSLATEYMAYNFAGCISLFASPPPGYHYLAGSDPTLASSYQVLTQNWLTAYGTQYWNSETSEGAGVSSAFCKHSKSPPPSNCPAP